MRIRGIFGSPSFVEPVGLHRCHMNFLSNSHYLRAATESTSHPGIFHGIRRQWRSPLAITAIRASNDSGAGVGKHFAVARNHVLRLA